MRYRFIKTPEKNRIIEELNEQFGIEELPYLLIESGKEKIRAFSGSLTKEEIVKIGAITNVEGIGLYLLKREDKIRPSFEGSIVLKDQIKTNTLEITEEQFKSWIKGNDLDIKTKNCWIAIKYNEDIIGIGKSTGEKILNHVPKDRRLRK